MAKNIAANGHKDLLAQTSNHYLIMSANGHNGQNIENGEKSFQLLLMEGRR